MLIYNFIRHLLISSICKYLAFSYNVYATHVAFTYIIYGTHRKFIITVVCYIYTGITTN